MSRALFVLATVVLVAGIPVVGVADESPDADQQALDYYAQAGEAYEEGQFERAAELLERAYDHDERLVYRYNQILALEAAGDYDAALALVEDYQDKLDDHEDFEDIAEIRGELEEAVEPDEPEEQDDVEEVDEQIEPADEPREAPNLVGWSLVGGAGASLAGGLVVGSGVLIGDTVDRLESAGDQGEDAVYGDTDYSRDDDLSTLRTHRWLTAGLLVGAAALGGAGAAVLWSDRQGGDDAAARGGVQLHPTVDIDSVGAMFTFDF